MQIGLMSLPNEINRQLIPDDTAFHINPITVLPNNDEAFTSETADLNQNVKTIPAGNLINTPTIKTYHIKVIDCLGKNITNDYVITDERARDFIYPMAGEFLINELFGKEIFLGKANQNVSNARRFVLGNNENIIIRDYSKCILFASIFLIFLLWPRKK